MALPEGEEQPDVDAAIAMFTPCFIAGIADLPEEMLPLLAEEAVPIKAQRAAAEIAPAGEGSRPALTNLASALCSR